MFCTQCGHSNRDTAKFCAQCGAELLRRTAIAPNPPAPHPAPEPAVAMPPASAATRAEAETPSVDEAAAGNTVPASSISSSRNAIVLGSVVLVCVLAAATTWMLTRGKAPEATTPLAEAVEETQAAPASGTASGPAPLPPAPAPESLPPAPGMPVKPTVEKPVVLSEAEVKRLVARLQQEPAPASCQAAAQKIRKDSNTGPAQAGDIAKRAYPQLCAPSNVPVAPVPSQAENRTIDQLYEERAAAECAKGLTGLLCREVLHNKLCSGRWSANPPAGQSRCLRVDSVDNN